MSRVEQRKKNRRGKVRLRLGMIIIIALLAISLLIVDGAHRDILATGEGERVLGYYRQGAIHYIQLIGREIQINEEVVLHQLEGYLGQWRGRLESFKEYLSQ